MPREHASIKMELDELRSFLDSDVRCVVATMGAGDRPWADAAAYVFEGDRLYFSIFTSTRTFENIAHDARVCCVVEAKPEDSSYYDIKGAMLHGIAQPIEGDAIHVHERLAALSDPLEPERQGERAVFSVGLDDSTSFSFDKIQYRYEDRSLET
jgi:nitroimidazol reductase NimA-like FMN-containing flavoprotein (pyridoxamine 5'-phosphate oxidase superfamily)